MDCRCEGLFIFIVTRYTAEYRENEGNVALFMFSASAQRDRV